MRKSRDGDSTKETVMAAAKEIFAEKGFSGTSLGMISDRCGVSEGLILHHFQSKKNLYHVILSELGKEYHETVAETSKMAENPRAAGPDLLRTSFEFWSKDKTYNRMSLWAYLENQTELIDEEMKITTELASALQKMQANGQVDDRYSPFVLLTMMIGPIHFWTRYRDQFKETLKLEGSAKEMDADFMKQYIALIQKLYQVEK